LTEASEDEDISQTIVEKMNICASCTDSDFFEELHYSDQTDASETEEMEETTYVSDDESASESLKHTNKQPIPKLPEINSFYPYKKKTTASTSFTIPDNNRVEEPALFKKIIKTNSLIYVPVQV